MEYLNVTQVEGEVTVTQTAVFADMITGLVHVVRRHQLQNACSLRLHSLEGDALYEANLNPTDQRHTVDILRASPKGFYWLYLNEGGRQTTYCVHKR